MSKLVSKIFILMVIIITLSFSISGVNVAFADEGTTSPVITDINSKPPDEAGEKTSETENLGQPPADVKSGQSPETEEVKKPVNKGNDDIALVLVNKNTGLAIKYVPEKLRQVKARCIPGINTEQKLMQEDAAKALEEMFNAADKEKIKLYCVSGYRSYNTQSKIYNYKVKTMGKKMVERYTAYPGSSEHQTGLAMDVTNKSGINKYLSESFAYTKEGKWLKSNAYKYGFIIRYPLGKEKITGYSYEPWHVRYVGKEAALKITKDNLVLEEYLEGLKKVEEAAVVK